MDLTKRLYIFTGKGGVGKTTLSLAFCKHLEAQNKKYLYTYIQSNKLELKQKGLTQQIPSEIKQLELNLKDCSKGYIAKKLNSDTIANWITKTPFYQSLINMIPGFSYVIYLGQLMELLEQDPELIIVLDSPSSGHTITMLEATKNFSQIFQSGPIYNDTQKMIERLESPNYVKINIICLPTLLAIHEGQELREELNKLHKFNIQILANNILTSYENENLPSFLLTKIKNEKEALHEEPHLASIPYSTAPTQTQILKEIVPMVQSLV